MPYQKRTTKKRTYRKKPVAEKRIRKVVQSEMKKEIELKFHDRFTTGSIEFSTLTSISPITGLTRGITANSYIGNRIKLTSLEIRGAFFAADVPHNVVRMVIVQMGAQTNVPNFAYLFGSSTNGLYAPFNKDNQDQYRLLKDKMFVLRNDGVSSSNFVAKPFRYFISGKKLRQMQFSTTAGNLDGGDIYICLLSDSTVTVHPSFILSMRINYHDA